MNRAIVESSNPVTLIGGGALSAGDLADALALAPDLVAADGGAVAALAAGHVPKAVIGDFDSLPARVRAQLPDGHLFPVGEQDSTDFDKALRHISAPAVVAVGFLGARVDHQLAAFHTLAQPGRAPCILLGETEVIFHLTDPIDLPLMSQDVVSLFPLQPVTGRSQGLEWPIDGLQLPPLTCIGTSNRALGSVRLEVDGPGLFCILPRRHLAAVLRLLGAAPE